MSSQLHIFVFFFKQKTAYEMRISDWSSDVCSSDLEAFIAALLEADRIDFREWEKKTPYFEGCLPIEVMAARGPDTLRFGPMKPVGLTDPRTGRRPWAVVQLRQDNALGTLFNLVGFQTTLKWGEQSSVLHMIPGLEKARIARFGSIQERKTR